MENENANKSSKFLINGEKYDYKDLTQEQIYFLRQIQSCNAKINNLKFELDQLQTALTSYNQKLVLSVENSSEKKMG